MSLIFSYIIFSYGAQVHDPLHSGLYTWTLLQVYHVHLCYPDSVQYHWFKQCRRHLNIQLNWRTVYLPSKVKIMFHLTVCSNYLLAKANISLTPFVLYFYIVFTVPSWTKNRGASLARHVREISSREWLVGSGACLLHAIIAWLSVSYSSFS